MTPRGRSGCFQADSILFSIFSVLAYYSPLFTAEITGASSGNFCFCHILQLLIDNFKPAFQQVLLFLQYLLLCFWRSPAYVKALFRNLACSLPNPIPNPVPVQNPKPLPVIGPAPLGLFCLFRAYYSPQIVYDICHFQLYYIMFLTYVNNFFELNFLIQFFIILVYCL